VIVYINQQLNEWGLWSMSGGRVTLGYPHQAPYCRLMPRSASGGSAVSSLADDEAMRIERAVRALPPDLRRLVVIFYVKMRSAPAESIAKHLHCCRDTVYARLHRAHVLVMGELMDD
jgi:DNA-directed RNA polymerase specialized sigma24 family protein